MEYGDSGAEAHRAHQFNRYSPSNPSVTGNRWPPTIIRVDKDGVVLLCVTHQGREFRRYPLVDEWQLCSGNNVIQTRNIEVVDWEENVDDIMEVIRKKCKRAYPEHYLLLVNARNSGKVLDFDRVIQEMKAIRSPFLEIWVVAFVGHDDMQVVRVAPGTLSINLKIRAELEKGKKQTPFIKRGKRGTGTELRDLGPAYLPIPGRD